MNIKPLECSLCHASENAQLMVVPGALPYAICERCAILAARKIIKPHKKRRQHYHCDFCNEDHAYAATSSEDGLSKICPECVGFSLEVLAYKKNNDAYNTLALEIFNQYPLTA
ncbi:MAG: hypothetical protein OEY38_16410 [Gammaproteobacteria bacterium]|nr:hypothetical protein [Gammaproteobacteria bacterium]